MKLFYTFILIVLISSELSAQTLVSSQIVSKGVTYKKYTASGPNNVFVLQVDLSDPTIKLQVAKSNDVIGGTSQTVKQIAASKDNNGNYHNVLAAVNGDFFNQTTFNNINLMVNDGQVHASKFLNPKRSVFGISNTNIPFISRTAENYRVIKSSVSTTINKVNGSRGSNDLVLYNQYKGTSTGTSGAGTEVKLGLANGQVWKANGAVVCTVLSKTTSSNTSFSAGQAVLSGAGSAATYLNTFTVGETITLQLDIASNVSNIIQEVGGFPKLLHNGINVAQDSLLAEGGTLDQDSRKAPRTGVGFSQDKNTLWMVVVDSGTTSSVGMSMTSFANFMSYLGAYTAINLDGGGSSTLVANNVVKNDPSDAAGERPVASALLAWTTSRLFEDFEVNEGKFANKTPNDGGSVGIGASTLDRIVTTGAYSGGACERAVLTDNTSSSSNWVVRLMSGDGVPANNIPITSDGVFSVWLKTSTANTDNGAKIYLRFDEGTSVTEETPGLTIINDGQWHQYNFDLNYTSGGTSIVGGNGVLANTVTFESIILKQNNTASTWTVDFDEITHNLGGSGTNVTSFISPANGSKVQLDFGEALQNENNEHNVEIFPNPNKGNFTLSFSNEDAIGAKFSIVNLSGKNIYSGIVKKKTENIDINNCQPGLYILYIKANNYSKTIKFLIEK